MAGTDRYQNLYPHSYVAYLAWGRLVDGARKYGNLAYLDKDVLAELQDELLDIINYAYLEWLKVQRLRDELRGDEEAELKVGGTDD